VFFLVYLGFTDPQKSLRGHRDQITAIRFLSLQLPDVASSSSSGSGVILTCAKDTFLKLWNLGTQHCVQTVVAHRDEVWTLDASIDEQLVFTGSSEGELKAWKLDHVAVNDGLKESRNGQVGNLNFWLKN
jgi:U3 small nucleolar RNA-associated protein 12